MRSTKEVEDLLADAIQAACEGTEWPGMSYEQGVEEALRWVLGETDVSPLEDE